MVEVLLSNLKTMMLVKGRRYLSTLFAFTEVMIWGLFVSGLIATLNSNFIWLITYCLGYASGCFVASIVEDKLALGKMDIQIIAPMEYKQVIKDYLIKNQYGFYIEHCEGAAGENIKVCIIALRKKAPSIRKHISEICGNKVFVTNYDIPYSHGGYGTTKSRGC